MIQNARTELFKTVERLAPDELFKMGEFIAKSGMFGCQTVAQGAVIAQHCEFLGISWLQWQADYDMVNGKPRMKAEAMLRRLREMGGKYEWKTDSDDDEKAILTVEFDGKSVSATYTQQQAHAAGLIKKGGAWETQRPAMLRARASTIGVRMVCPEALGGFSTVEEAEEIEVNSGSPSAPAIDDDVSPPKRGPGRPKKSAANDGDPSAPATAPATTNNPAPAAASETKSALPGPAEQTSVETQSKPAGTAEQALAPAAVDPRISAIKQCAEYRKELAINDETWAKVLEKIQCPAGDDGKRTLLKADEETVRKVLAWLIKQAEAKRAKDTDKSAEAWANAGMPTQQQAQAAAV